MNSTRLQVLNFALAAGLWLGICLALTTAASLLGVPGFAPAAQALASVYGPWGYSVTWPGVLMGFVWGFVEGFIHLGFFAWLYNRLLDRRG